MHWTNHWEEISAHIAQRPSLLLATDFDGTLASIAATPAEAVLPTETRALLRRLMMCPGTHLAVISGRSLADVRMHVNIDGIFYVGNHGLELSGPGVVLHSSHASQASGELERMVAFLVEQTAHLDGVFIEEKGASASVHWRLATDESREKVHSIVRAVLPLYPRLRLSPGKCVWELRPKEGWNKGDALTHLMARLRLEPGNVFYFGDDLTDEDAFCAVPGGLTFRVGGKDMPTAARYRIHDAADVKAFLLCMLGVRSKTSAITGIDSNGPMRDRLEFANPNDLIQRAF